MLHSFFNKLLGLAWLDQHPSRTTWYIYLCVLGMAAGGVAALLPGAINLEVSPGIRASGALAVVVFIVWFGKDKADEGGAIQGLTSHLDYSSSSVDPSSDIYVTINSKLAAYDPGLSHHKELDFGQNVWTGAKQVSVSRGNGGIQLYYAPRKPGDKINVISRMPSGLWLISNDMIVPQGELEMRASTLDEAKARSENAQ